MAKHKKKHKGKWIQKAREGFERKGTVGAFGPATKKNVARGKRKGGVEKKRAVFAENMRKIAQRRKRRHGARR